MNEYSFPTQFIDLKAQQELIRDRLDIAVKKVLDHGQYIMGPEVKEFESNLKEFTGAKHALTCANGTDAISIVLMAWGSRSWRCCIRPLIYLYSYCRGTCPVRSNTFFRRR